ncbi:hypothetical protein [Nocardia mexicana]|uniref:Xaa-Pro dipeptidase n=1 Tax=Nocardia mexicana TaxID=279262 RepID=A0A370HH60_9NOCA|nr:hypothetical protein [Nocardia mexicana]RDI56110.1 hypothetical protein DFR68_101947 [Nocardia mexicana]
MTATLLPKEFADLEPFAETWCLASESERYARRLASTMTEMQSFYDAITPRAEAALAYCDGFALDDLPDEVQHLLYLLYSMITVSFPVEVWSQPRIPDTGAAALECVVEPIP